MTRSPHGASPTTARSHRLEEPKPLEHSLREAVARIIDPNAFAYWPAVDLSKRLEKALSKADAILALPEALLGVSQSQPGCDAPDGAASASVGPPAAQFCLLVVRSFIEDQRITCSEAIYQMDRVMVNAPEFIERLCDIAGYAEDQP